MTPGAASLAELFADTPEELRRQALSHSSWVEQANRVLRPPRLPRRQRPRALGRRAPLRGHPDADIGELTKILNQAVSGRACAEVARRLGLPEHARRASPERGRGPARRDTARLRADAGVGLRGGDRRLLPGARIRADLGGGGRGLRGRDRAGDAGAARLQVRAAGAARPRRGDRNYEVVSEAGPPHDRRFEIRATVGDDELGGGSGRSKKEAEQAAAERALEKLRA